MHHTQWALLTEHHLCLQKLKTSESFTWSECCPKSPFGKPLFGSKLWIQAIACNFQAESANFALGSDQENARCIISEMARAENDDYNGRRTVAMAPKYGCHWMQLDPIGSRSLGHQFADKIREWTLDELLIIFNAHISCRSNRRCRRRFTIETNRGKDP